MCGELEFSGYRFTGNYGDTKISCRFFLEINQMRLVNTRIFEVLMSSMRTYRNYIRNDGSILASGNKCVPLIFKWLIVF